MSEQAETKAPDKGNSPTHEEVVKLFDLASLEVFYGFNLRDSLLQCTREEFDTIYRVFERAQSARTNPGTSEYGRLGDSNEHP